MPARIQAIVGPALCGKTTKLLARYRTALGQRRFGHTLWLAPTQRSAFDIRGRLLSRELDACLTPGVMTFAQFAESVLQASTATARAVTSAMKRHLVRRVIQDATAAGRLQYFAPIADTPGLAELVGQWIGELKRLEIWPEEFRAACTKRGLLQKDCELLGLYEAYQHALTGHDLYDAEGRFWWARQLLRDGQVRPFEHIRLVVVDGFTDFTRTQHEILEVLSQRADELLVSLPLEADSRRTDLFAKTQATLEDLQRRHLRLEVHWLHRPEHPAWRALAHLERQLFKNPREAEVAADATGISILAASRNYGEIVQIGRQIKELLTTGTPASGNTPVKPSDVAVVFRRLADSASLVREVFDELGIPTAIETGEALDYSPALAALVNLLELDREDWPFRRLLSVLGNSYFRPSWPEWEHGHKLAVVERVIRELQVPQGRAELLRRVQWWAETEIEDDPTTDVDRLELRLQRREEARLALPVLIRLAQCYERLPNRASPAAWVVVLTRLADETGFLHVIQTPVDTARPTNEVPAWDRLRQALTAAEQLADWLGEEPPQWDRRQLIDAVLDVLRGEQLPAPHDETGRVRVLSAASLRSLSVPFLFFAGLSETAMPGADREDRLYSDAEYQQLHGLGLPLVLRRHRNQEEMLLFYEVATRATRWLQLSYPALDDKAQSLLPSPYVNEVSRAMGPTLVPLVLHDLSPLPLTRCPRSATEFRLLAVHESLYGDNRLLAALVRQPPLPQLGQRMLWALQMLGQRAQRNQFGPFEGILASDAARARLADRFGPDRLFSASHLELYAGCPYRFFLARVLKLRELPEVSLATDFAHRGGRLHAVMAALHHRINAQHGRALSPASLPEESFLEHITACLDQEIALDEDVRSLEHAMTHIDRETVAQWLKQYPDQHRTYDNAWSTQAPPAPTYFEVSFGMHVRDRESISREEPLEISVAGVTVKLSGRIDRIDIGREAGQPIFNVIDYKSGWPRARPKDPTLNGTTLQLEVYAIAVQDLLLKSQEAIPWEAGYWYVKGKGYSPWFSSYQREGKPLKTFVEWPSRRREVEQKVAELVAGIRAAQFPVYSLNEQCTGSCPYRTVCRINQVRSLEKSWPEMATLEGIKPV